MRLNNFAYNLTKLLLPCLGAMVALLVGCDGGSNGALNGLQGGFSYATVDDLPNCSGTREGEVALVESDSTANLCTGGIWHNIGASVATEDALQNCSPNREGKKIYVVESARSLFCTDGRWVEYGTGISSNNGVASSSSSHAIMCSSSEKQSCGDIVYGTLTDTRDGRSYKTVTIGTQTWMAQNLNYVYNEGTAKSYCTERIGWSYCDGMAEYGRQYLWSAAMDSAGVFTTSGKGCGFLDSTCSAKGTVRGVCPDGWHLPSRSEWKTLFRNVGGEASAGRMLKSVDEWAYDSDMKKGIDCYGFAVLPATRFLMSDLSDYKHTRFWASTITPDYQNVYTVSFSYAMSSVVWEYISVNSACSIRCIKDSN